MGELKDSSGNSVDGVTAKLSYTTAGNSGYDSREEQFEVNGAYDFARNDVVQFALGLHKDGYYVELAPIPEIGAIDKDTSCVNGIQTFEGDVVMEPVETDLPDLRISERSISENSTDSLYCLNANTLKKERLPSRRDAHNRSAES